MASFRGIIAIDSKRSSGVAGILRCGLPALCALVGLAGCGRAQLQPAGPVSFAERTIFFDSFAIMLAVIVPVIVATLGVAWWFRGSNARARRMPTWAYSGRIELIIWSIPTLVIVFLGGIAWIGSHDLDPARPLPSRARALTIEVVALDWKWLFIYPEQGIASINRLVVPAGVPLHLMLTSATVWNVFWVPQLGSMLYCMNGMVGTLYLEASRPGIYYGESAMISGDGFAGMHFNTDAVPAGEFSSWAASTRAAGPVLDTRSYLGLLRPTMSVKPYTYRSVQPSLFRRIVLQKLPPGQGPGGGVTNVPPVD